MFSCSILIILFMLGTVGSFRGRFLIPLTRLCTVPHATRDMIRELENPVGILKEKSTEGSAYEMNVLATRLISRCSSTHRLRNCYDIYDYLSTVCEPDSRTQTALMSACISHRKFEDALRLFQEMKQRGVRLDKVAYTNAVRAIGRSSFHEAKELLHEALVTLGPTQATQVFHAALTNFKFITRYPANETSDSQDQNDDESQILLQAKELLELMISGNITISSKTMDIYLSIMCAHGADAHVEEAHALRQKHGLEATDFTLNIIVDHYLSSSVQSFKEVLALIKALSIQWGVRPDAVTINTLLKHCIDRRDVDAADRVLALMADLGVQPGRWTNELLVTVDGLRGNTDTALHAVECTSDSELTPHMISSALKLCDNSTTVLRLVNRALALGVADSAVIALATKTLVSTGEFESAHRMLHSLWQHGVQLDKYVVSAMLTTVFTECRMLEEQDSERGSIRGRITLLKQYLQTIKSSQPELLTSNVCQRVVRELVTLAEYDAACSIHLQLFSRCTVQTDILTALFQGMQDLSVASAQEDMEYSVSLAKKSLALFHTYAFSNSSHLYTDSTHESHTVLPLALLRSTHVNNVLKMLSTAKLYDFCEKLFHILSHHQFEDATVASTTHLRMGRTLRPTLFTIAELIRIGRASGRTALARNVMLWAVESNTHIPLDLVRDSVSFLYSQGEVEMARALYEQLYIAGKVQHWAVTDGATQQEPIMDLHFFSRGMAYAAINCAIREVRTHRTLGRTLTSSGKPSSVTLTIITGRNLPQAPTRPSSAATEAYRLSSEIQSVLIDDFFPPISSSTVPGNPGRLYITLPL